MRKYLRKHLTNKWVIVIGSFIFIGLITYVQYQISINVPDTSEFNISDAIPASVAMTGVLLTAFSYYKYKEEQRVKMTASYNKEYRTDSRIQEVLRFLIEHSEQEHEPRIDAETINQREMFLRFFEEIQYLIDQNLIEEKQAYDLFGYYANEAWKMKDAFIPNFGDELDNWEKLNSFIKGYKHSKR